MSGWPEGYRFLSVDSFRQRFKRFECVLPYAYIYYRNRDYNAWADVLAEEQNPVILPEDFEVWNAYFWGELTRTRRIRMRAPLLPLGINFQWVVVRFQLPNTSRPNRMQISGNKRKQAELDRCHCKFLKQIAFMTMRMMNLI